MLKNLTKINRKLICVHPEIKGDSSNLIGDCSNLSGNCSNIFGDCSSIQGNLDNCDISLEERKDLINIKDLINTER